MELFSDEADINPFKTDYANASIRYGDLKSKIAADAVVKLAPIREKIEYYIVLHVYKLCNDECKI